MDNTENTFQGVRVFDFSGQLMSEKIFPPKSLISILSGLGFSPSRIENEGVVVKNNTIYSMYIYSDRYHQKISRGEGIVILKDDVIKSK